jgi:hypothetical protein
MRKAQLDVGVAITMIIFVFGMVWAYSALLAHEGKIVIQQNYKTDYEVIQQNYEACLIREKASPAGIVWIVIAGIFYLGSMVVWFFTNRSLDKKREKFDEREKKLKEREENFQKLMDSKDSLKIPLPPKRRKG